MYLVSPTDVLRNPIFRYTIDAATVRACAGNRRSGWGASPGLAVPVLAMTAFQFGTHAVNHLVDIDEADPEWVGVVDLVGLSLGTLALAWLLRHAVGETE